MKKINITQEELIEVFGYDEESFADTTNAKNYRLYDDGSVEVQMQDREGFAEGEWITIICSEDVAIDEEFCKLFQNRV